MKTAASNLSLSTTFSRTPGLAQRLFEERMLIVTPADSILHRLNEVGSVLWELLEESQTVENLCSAINERFDGFDKQAHLNDILIFLSAMKDKGLVLCQN